METDKILDLVAFRAEVARRVNARLAELTKPGTMPEVVSALSVGKVLAYGDWPDGRNCELIREIAEQVTRETGGKA